MIGNKPDRQAWYNERFSNNPDANKLGVLATASAIAYEDGLGIFPWQDDFFTWAVGYAWALGFPEARSLLNWKAKFPVGRMVDADFCWILASEYMVIVRADKNSDQLFETMGQVYAATIANRANCKGIRLGDIACASREMADWRTTARTDKKQSLGPAAMTEMVGYPQSAEGFPANMQPALAVQWIVTSPVHNRLGSVSSHVQCQPITARSRNSQLCRLAPLRTKPRALPVAKFV